MKKEISIIITLYTKTTQVNAQCRQNTYMGFHSLALENNGRLRAGAGDLYGQPDGRTNSNQHQL